MSNIILIDPNKDFCFAIKNYIERDSNFRITSIVHDGALAIDAIREGEPDLVIMENILPNRDGLGILHSMRSAGISSPVLMLSSIYSDKLLQNGYKLGLDYFLAKPFDLDDLMSRIRMIKSADLPDLVVDTGSLQSEFNPEVKISAILQDMGVPANIRGYKYLRHAILLSVGDSDLLNYVTKELYPEVAKEYSTTPSRVERAIRHAIEVAWSRGKVEVINSFFGYTISQQRGKPTNSEFIALISDRLRLSRK